MEKANIVETLEQIADLLELKGENAFKVRAYRSGARALENTDDPLGELIDSGRLASLDGIGKALVEKIGTLYRDGRLPYLDDLRASIPDGLVELLKIPFLGPKKVKKLYDELQIDGVETLRAAAESGRIRALAGFGAKTEEKILKGIENLQAWNARHLWSTARPEVERILDGLRSLPETLKAEAAGSFRRYRETIGDLDFIASSSQPEPLTDWFCSLEGVAEVTARGRTKSSIRLENGMQADLRIVPPDRFFYALHHFTGSKEHNVRLRQRALERGLSLSEWGLFNVDERSSENASDRQPDIEAHTEEDLFAALGLAWIPPELREDRGEIAEAEAGGGTFRDLVTPSSIRGVFHNHTTASDGRNTLQEMIAAAAARGWDYLGISDHSKSSYQASGLDEERLIAQIDLIREINASNEYQTHVFAGSEVDILRDGSLDFDDSILEQLDFVVASVHNAFSLSEAEMTQRIIRAIEHPCVTMLGHLSGRLLLRREPYPINIPKVIDAAIANATIVELNASPLRLELDWRHWRKAADAGLLCSINPDAHSIEHYDFVEFGVQIARKGWLRPENIVNTRPLSEVHEFLRLKK